MSPTNNRRRHSLVIIARSGFIAAIIAICYLATTPVDHEIVRSLNDKFNHALAFLALMALLDFSFPYTSHHWKKVAPLLLFGGAIEAVQSQLPFRQFSILDWCADGAGIAAYFASVPLLKRLPLLQWRWV